jgi:hypothetical protein
MTGLAMPHSGEQREPPRNSLIWGAVPSNQLAGAAPKLLRVPEGEHMTTNSESGAQMPRKIRRLAIAGGLLLAAACAGQQATTDYSPSTSFSQYRSFALVMPPDSGSQQLLDQRVRNAVEAQLLAKGLIQTDRESADLFVGYGMVDKTHTRIYSYNDGWGWGGRWGWRYWRWGVAWPMTVQRQVETYTDGTVVVNLVDAKTKQVVWEGEVPGVLPLPVSSPTGATEKINAAVVKLFTKYPPQA